MTTTSGTKDTSGLRRRKRRTLADLKRQSPCYLLNWRYRRAYRLAQARRLRKLALDDGLTFRAAKYIRHANRLAPLPAEMRERKLRILDAELFVVSCIAFLPEYQPIKRSLILRLLAGQNDSAISQMVSLSASEVKIFHDLFFWIRPQLGFDDVILSRVRGKTAGLGTNEFDARQIQKYFAYMLGPDFIELVLSAGDKRPPDASTIAKELWRDFVADQHALVVQQPAIVDLVELLLRAA